GGLPRAKAPSSGLAHNHLWRRGVLDNGAWGRPRLRERSPPPAGNGYWSQEIYYHMLNCGLRLPPSAGSASGVLPNPVGYNRVYVHVGKDLGHDKWWDGLRAGRSFVTNGPLLRVRSDDKLRGHVFTAAKRQEIVIDLKASLTTRDAVERIEVIKDGAVERAVPFEEWSKTGSLGKLSFKASGWFLVRAVTGNKKTFRFASTAPWYVEVGDEKGRGSKAAARFFPERTQDRGMRAQG